MTSNTLIDASNENKLYTLPQRVLIWRRFRKHRLAMFSLVVVIFIYMIGIFAEFLAPYPPGEFNSTLTYSPPQQIRLFDGDRFAPHVFGVQSEVDPESMRRIFSSNPEEKIFIRFIGRGFEYRVLGLFTTDIHFLVPSDPEAQMHLLGTDRLGRDMLSRIFYGTRISTSVGLLGVILSLFLGIILGGISGYAGGLTDNIIQRSIDFIRSLPTIPLWLGLSAALPADWSPLQRYFTITLILSLVGWTSLARIVRGKFLTLRNEDYIHAAHLEGASQARIIRLYMLPAMFSHIIASITLAIPQMIIAETALSFLGLGLRAPTISWGVLLEEAQNVRTISTAPWLLSPAIIVIVTVLSLNFLGDGLRDAADPYQK